MQIRITPLLTWRVMTTAIAFVILICVGLGIISYKLYKKVLATEASQKLIIETQKKERLYQEQKSRELIAIGQEALKQAQNDLTKTKNDADKTNAELKTLAKTLETQAKDPKDITISSADLSPYLTGAVQVICVTQTGISSGSGILWTFKEVPYAIVTNYHVVKDADRCVISITNKANSTTGIFNIKGSIYTFNKNMDAAILAVGSSVSSSSVPVANYNYSLAQVRKCTNLMPVGSPIVIIGYPAYAKRDSTITIDTVGTVKVIYRTVTNGIVSGYDTSLPGEPNYFVSAKIDNGNSGGVTLAKDSDGLCMLGLPTWLTVGNYETQGLVQNILNVLPK